MSYHEEFVCDVCGFRSDTKYWDNGMIEHENHTSDWNLSIDFESGGVRKLSVLPKDKTDKFIEYVVKHRRMWLEENQPEYVDKFDSVVQEKLHQVTNKQDSHTWLPDYVDGGSEFDSFMHHFST